MSDFLGSLAARSAGPVEGVRPRPTSLFEPQRGAVDLALGLGVDDPTSERIDSDQPIGPARGAPRPAPDPWPALSAPALPAPPQPTATAPRARALPSDLVDPPAPRRPAPHAAPSDDAPAPAATPYAPQPILPARALSADPLAAIAPILRADQAHHDRPAVAPSAIERITTAELRERQAPFDQNSTRFLPPRDEDTKAGSPEALVVSPSADIRRNERVVDRIVPPEARPALAPITQEANERHAPPIAAPAPILRADAPIAGPPRPTPAAIVVQPRIQPHADPPAPPEAAPDAPIINVTIGRIDVRAAPAAAQPPQRQRAAPPVMSLEDYLRQRAKGGSG